MQLMKDKRFWLAVLMTLACSLLGKFLSTLPGLNLIGTLVIALILGMLMQLFKGPVTTAKPGIAFISNKFLRLGIILLGFRLNLKDLAASGVKTLLLAALVVTFAIFVIYGLSRLFKVEKTLALLTACGCGICGAAAIMGISPQIKAKNDDSVLAVAVICILGTVFTLIIVTLQSVWGLTDTQYGILCGGSLHEIAHAVAAGGAGSTASLDTAIIMKLSRVLMLVPVSIIVGVIHQRKEIKAGQEQQSGQKIPIPWFMLGFLLTSAMGSFFAIPSEILGYLVDFAYIFLGMAMAALGMNVNFQVIVKRGASIIAAAAIGSALVFGMVIIAAKLFF